MFKNVLVTIKTSFTTNVKMLETATTLILRHGYFYPCVELNIAYALDDDMLAPVYRGNIIKPSEAASAPEISWDSKEDDLWTLGTILT